MIGIFDSGIGGLTVLKEIKRALRGYDLVYFGDTARLPYGNKSAELIRQYALEDAEFLLEQGAQIIVVACNSASAVALDFLQEKIDVPVFGVIKPAVKEALQTTSNGRIGVIGTRATVNSKVYEREIMAQLAGSQEEAVDDLKIPAFMRKGKKGESGSRKIEVFSQAAPLLVPLIEEGYAKKGETKRILKRYLLPLKMKQVDTLILGCTHYPIIKDIIQDKFRRAKLIDPAVGVAKELRQFLQENLELDRSLSKRGQEKFFVSDLTEHTEDIARLFLGRKVELNKI